MKKLLIALLLIAILNESCATVYGGAITDCQRHRPKKGEPSRELRSGALTFDILGSIFLFGVPLIIDFATRAIYKPCPEEEKEITPVIVTKKNNEALNDEEFIYENKGFKTQTNYCNDITKKVDKFNGKITYNTPYMLNIPIGIVIYSVVMDADTSFSVIMEIETSTYNVNCEGVYIIFDDGSKWMFETNKVEMNVSHSGTGFKAQALFHIYREDLKKLSEHTITDFKLYIYDTVVPKRVGNQFKEHAKCMLNL